MPDEELVDLPDSELEPVSSAAARSTAPPGLAAVSDDPLESEPTRVESATDSHGSAQTPVDGPRLLVVGGNDRGRSYTLQFSDNSIGRGLDNDLVVADIAVSRRHTIVRWDRGRFLVRDLGSGNGTLVNGQRIDEQVLQDGDQIEIGHTVVHFLAPGSANAVALATAVTEVGVSEQLRDAQPSATTIDLESLRRRTPQVAPKREGSRLSRRSKHLAIFGSVSLLLLFAAMLGVRAIIRRQGRVPVEAPAVSPKELAARHFEAGLRAYRARRWDVARENFLKVLAVEPNFSRARRYADIAGKELRAQEAIGQAKSAIAAENYDTARGLLRTVGKDTSYRAEVPPLLAQTDRAQAKQLMDSARLLKDSGDLSGARTKLDRVLQIVPDHAEALSLRSAMAQPSGIARPKPTPVRPRRRPLRSRRARPQREPAAQRASVSLRQAILPYKRQQWSAAKAALERLRRSTKSSRLAMRAQRLSELVAKIEQLVLGAQRIQSKEPSRALASYRKALKLDASVPGQPLQSILKAQLYKVARYQASSELAHGRYRTAYRAVKVAQRYGLLDGPLKKVLSELESRAKELFTRGYTLRSRDPARARQLWQQVLHIVPATSETYQKAYTWLNQSAPAYDDEDED